MKVGEETRALEEVLKIIKIVKNPEDEGLERIALSLNVLKCTEGGNPDSLNPFVLDEEEGLPTPMDDLSFLVTQPTAMELGGFLDGMDVDGNPKKSEGLNKKDEQVKRSQTGKPPIPPVAGRPVKSCLEQKVHTETKFQKKMEKSTTLRRPLGSQQDKSRCQAAAMEAKLAVTKQVDKDSHNQNRGELNKKKEMVPRKVKKDEQVKKQQTLVLKTGRPIKPSLEQNVVQTETKLQQKPANIKILRRPLGSQQDKSRMPDAAVTKKRLPECYQQAENAKKRRIIHVVDSQDVPKQSLGQKKVDLKPVNNKPEANWRQFRLASLVIRPQTQ